MLYYVYNIPNFVLPLFGGLFLDRIGIRLGMILFTCFVTLGQGVFMYGAYQDSFAILVVARVIFGLGGECMGVAQSSIISYWYKGKMLAFALAINLSIARLGSVAMSNTAP